MGTSSLEFMISPCLPHAYGPAVESYWGLKSIGDGFFFPNENHFKPPIEWP